MSVFEYIDYHQKKWYMRVESDDENHQWREVTFGQVTRALDNAGFCNQCQIIKQFYQRDREATARHYV